MSSKYHKRSLLKFIYATIIAVLTFVFICGPVVTVNAYTQNDLDAIKKQLADIKSKENNLKNQINSEKKIQNQLSSQINQLKLAIDLLNNQIEEKELVIQQLNVQIDLFTQNITALTEQIQIAETNIATLEKETDRRMVDIYIAEKTNSQLNVFFNSPGTDLIKYTTYQDSYHKQTNQMVEDLTAQRNDLNSKKADLEKNKADVMASQMQLDSERLALTESQSQLAQQKNDYYNKLAQSQSKSAAMAAAYNDLSDQEKKAASVQDRIEQDLFNQVKNITSNTYVQQGTIIARQGYTGYVIPKGPAGAHVHFSLAVNGASANPCSYLPQGTISGCGVASGAKLAWPLHGTFYLTSWYGSRWGSFHDAIDIASPDTNAFVYAGNSGWITKGRWSCNDSRVCNTPYVNYAIICENKNCSVGLKTLYLHLSD